MKYDVCIIGGFGHVGLPLAIAFASKGLKTCAFDISSEKKQLIESKRMPFTEENGDAMLGSAIDSGNLFLSIDKNDIMQSKNVVITIGTPLDEHGGPKLNVIEDMINQYFDQFIDGQLIILRSTVYPNTTNNITKLFESKHKKVFVTFCPERIVEGKALKEVFDLPQIIGADNEDAANLAEKLFKTITKNIVERYTLITF